MEITELYFKKLDEQAILPHRGSKAAAGLDLCAIGSVNVLARGSAVVSTGLAVAIPNGYYGRVAPRSGLAVKFGIDILAGVVDSDYRGELLIVLANQSDQDFTIKAGDRIAQLIIEAIILPTPVFVTDLPETKRGDGGFGSTGH